MDHVTFADPARYKLAQALLQNKVLARAVTLDPGQQAVDVADSRIARLLARLKGNQAVILPYPTSGQDHWLITASHNHLLDQVRARIDHFLIPSYGFFPSDASGLRPFKPSASPLQAAAADLYPPGYYRWQSPAQYRDDVLDRLMLWLDLEDDRPPELVQAAVNYQQLYDGFQQALATRNWEGAKQILDEIRQRHLTTADNLVFLRLQLLARQEQWAAIWQDPNFPVWTQLSMPRPIRTLLLTAFHHQVLLPLEEQAAWEAALAAFKEHRPRLGGLLTGPFDWDEVVNTRIVAYQAVVDGDNARLTLLQSPDLDASTTRVLTGLQSQADVVVSDEEEHKPYERALAALNDRDFATAERAIREIEAPTVRALLLMELAFHTEDDAIRDSAWQCYQSLSFEEQEALRDHKRFVSRYLDDLQDYAMPLPDAEAQPAPDAVETPQDATWERIREVEKQLRTLVADRYQAQFGDNWLVRVDDKSVERWQSLQEKDQSTFALHDESPAPLLDYSHLGDLLALINRQWNLFRDLFTVFGQGKQAKRALTRKLEAIIRVRNPLAHNRTVPDNELKRANVYCTDILLVLQNAQDEA